MGKKQPTKDEILKDLKSMRPKFEYEAFEDGLEKITTDEYTVWQPIGTLDKAMKECTKTQ
jgi:hypothetical protein